MHNAVIARWDQLAAALEARFRVPARRPRWVCFEWSTRPGWAPHPVEIHLWSDAAPGWMVISSGLCRQGEASASEALELADHVIDGAIGLREGNFVLRRTTCLGEPLPQLVDDVITIQATAAVLRKQLLRWQLMHEF